MKVCHKYFIPFLLITILFSLIPYLSFSQNLSKEQTLSYINKKWTQYGIHTNSQPIILSGDVIVINKGNKYVVNENFEAQYKIVNVEGKENYYLCFYDNNVMTGRMPFLSAEECQSVVKAFNYLKKLILEKKVSKKDPFK